MKFFADECCDVGIVASLRKEGYDVIYALEEKPGLPDDMVLQRAYVERRILLTEDKDFAECGLSLLIFFRKMKKKQNNPEYLVNPTHKKKAKGIRLRA